MAYKKKSKTISTKKHMAREQREAHQIRLIITVTIVLGIIILGLVGYGVINHLVIRPRKAVARVGEATISVSDFESYVKYTRAQMLNQTYQYYTFYQQFGEFGQSFLQSAQSMAAQLAQPVTLGRDVLDEMIDNQLIRAEADKRGITVSEEEIDQAIQAAFGFFPDGTPTPTVTATIQLTPTYSETQLALVTLTSTPTETPETTDAVETSPTAESEAEDTEESSEGSEAPPIEETPTPELSPTITLTPTITITPTPYTTEAFGENIRNFNLQYSQFNFDIKDLRELFKVQLLRDKLIPEILGDFITTKDEVWARHILVETEEEAFTVLSLLEEGEDFHELAVTYSIDESNRERGGDLGWFDRNTMVSEFAIVAFDLEVGETSDVVETAFGFHILQVLGKRESQIPPNELELEKQNAFSEWLAEQRILQSDQIIIYDGWESYVPNTPEIPQQLLMELFQ